MRFYTEHGTKWIVLQGKQKVVLFTFKYILSLFSCKNVLKNCAPFYFLLRYFPYFKGSLQVFQFLGTVNCDEMKCTSRAAVAYFIHLRLQK